VERTVSAFFICVTWSEHCVISAAACLKLHVLCHILLVLCAYEMHPIEQESVVVEMHN